MQDFYFIFKAMTETLNLYISKAQYTSAGDQCRLKTPVGLLLCGTDTVAASVAAVDLQQFCVPTVPGFTPPARRCRGSLHSGRPLEVDMTSWWVQPSA